MAKPSRPEAPGDAAGVRVDDQRWKQCTPSEFAWERAALGYLRTLLPNRDPFRAWANAEFLGTDGSVNEIDLLLVTPAGIVILEIKSWSGVLVGDAGTWRQTHRAPVDNPVIGAARKARKLKSLLASQQAMRGRRVPWIEGAVFLSDARLEVRLTPEGRAHVFGRHDQRELSSFLDYARQPGRVDADLSGALARAVDQAGIRQSQRVRTVGSLRLELPAFGEGPGWQDFLARHHRFAQDRPRRVRIYLASGVDSRDQRDQLVRAAEREYLALRGINHPGIATPVDFVEHDLGPAVVFHHDPDLIRLDHFLREYERELSFDDRLALLRGIAETMAYAHRRVLTHRGLSPRCVWVRRRPDGFFIQITDWQTASRGSESTTGASVTATGGYAGLADEATSAYFAPEWSWGTTNGVTLDVFGVGAIAYHLFTGGPPASTYGALTRRLAEHGRLSLAQQMDAVPAALDELVAAATDADPDKRTRDMAGFLLDLDLVRERLAAVEQEATVVVDPLEAEAGAELDGGFTVMGRLGRGSTALALLVERDGERAVLKVSLDRGKDSRLAAEAAALTDLGEHPGVVELLSDGVIDVGPRRALLVSFAGTRTLAQELRVRGRLQPEWLQEWGDDLLEIVQCLQQHGVAHRDIKPDNLGVAERGGKGKKRQLVLFDFSLAKEPLDSINAGTQPYLDPFLGHGERRLWDLAAERYAAAVTLYEMATARRPAYGAGGAHPGFTDADVTIDPELFDRSYATSLARFFRRALHRDAKKRFDTAEEMRRGWDIIFAEPAAAVSPAPVQRVGRETPIGAAGLSPQVLAVLERLDIAAVGGAIDLSPAQVVWLPGIGTKTRYRLREELDRLAVRVAESSAQRPNQPTLLDRVAAALVPDEIDRRVAEALLGLGEDGGSAWTSLRDAARTLGQEQRAVRDAVARFEEHWLALDGMRELRDTVVEVVESVGGVASARHCAAALLDFQGSTVEEPLRSRLAEAVVRAAIDAELADGSVGDSDIDGDGDGDGDPRLVYSREPHGILVAAGPLHAGDAPSTADRLDWASRLGAAADELAGTDPLPVPARVIERLRAVAAPGGTDPSMIFPERLVEVAVIASRSTAATPRLEVYPHGLDAGRALRLAAGALYGSTGLTPEQVAERIAARFPHATALPGRPDLDGLLESAGVPLRWDGDAAQYLARRVEAHGLTSLATYRGTTPRRGTGGTVAMTRAGWRRVEDRVLAMDDKLARSLADGGWLVLSVPPRRLVRVERCLAAQEVTVLDVESALLAGMRDFCERHRVAWARVLAADAAERTSREWANLSKVAQAGMTAVRASIEAAGPAVLLVNAGVLARYDASLTLFDDLRESVRKATAGAAVRTVWVLVPWADAEKQPLLDGGAPVPQFGNQWLALSEEWIARHESRLAEGGAA
ncbi:BREX system serine/threonine kinase PglW [Frankia sp. Cas3]|uniref:BREX system serine/threonine kinase PglW n=1 Tax=Frankia sp. Cas3 TaxID=3073926 RepID=UPI002AD572AF|nr:BREX system serine/threonine kinase PglW [Frankia sp. Cas3]